MKIFRCILIIMLVTGANTIVFAASPGASIFSFLKINPSARSVGMGELSCVTDIQNSMLNPGIIPWIEDPEVSLQYIKYIQDTSYNLLHYVSPFDNESAISLSIGMLGVQGLTRTLYDPDSTDGFTEDGGFEFSDRVLNIGYGFKVSRDLSLGTSLKYVQETIDKNSVGAALLGFGGFYYPWASEWQFTFGFNNLGAKTKNFDPPLAIYAGAGKQLYPYLLWGVETVVYADQVMEIKTGVEYNIKNMLFLRAGYRHLLEDQKLGELPMIDLAGGFGFAAGNFSFDYAWAPYGDLAQAHRISLGYKFK